jgi:crossover junction endodeoxyribonuclease RuvC
VGAIFGIDPSLTSTGYCVRDNGKTYAIGTILPKKLRGVERLLYIEKQLDELCISHLHTGDIRDLVVIEGYSFGSQGRAIFQIGELGGVIRRYLHLMEIPWVEVSPASLKKFVTGKGNTKKEHIMMHVLKRWGVECNNNNEADAFGLAMIGECLSGKATETQAQADVIKALKEVQGC